MENVLKIEVEIKAPELVQAIEGLKGLFSGSAVTNSVKTAEPQKEVVIQTIVEAESEEFESEQPEATSEVVQVDVAFTIDDVREALAGLAKQKGNASAKAILESFNVKKVTDLQPETFAAVMAQVKGV